MNYDFIAIRRESGDLVQSSISISNAGWIENRGYAYALSVSGIINFTTTIYGAFPFQAAMLAHEVARIRLAALEHQWRFEWGEMGEISFAWTAAD